MKLSVLALDYDGTIARNDRVPPSVLDAIADARRRNVTVILVTGRILDDLRRVAGDLNFVDGVVPKTGRWSTFQAAARRQSLLHLSLVRLWLGSRSWGSHSGRANV